MGFWRNSIGLGQIIQDRAVGPVIAMAFVDEVAQRAAHCLQFGELAIDTSEMLIGD